MRKVLIILNYQREIPPFMQNLIHFADSRFERILYFTPELYNDNRDSCCASKLEVVQCERSLWRIALFSSVLFLFSKSVRLQMKIARKNKIKLFPVIRQIHRHYVCAKTLAQKAIRFVKQNDINLDNSIVLGAWFSTEAYAINLLKEKFPKLNCCSFAHSFEINRNQNPYVMYDMNSFKHKSLDRMIFISKKMRKIYLDELKAVYPNLSDEKWNTIYLGSVKKYSSQLSSPSNDGVIRLVSCSSVVKVKRIHLIVKSLEKWNGDSTIIWTHIGGGPLLDEIKEEAKALLIDKTNVRFNFVGSLSNEDVQKYYVDNCIDLFVNVSSIEGLPVSIMEAISYGIPVIATNVGGTSEIVNDKTGYLLKKDFEVDEFVDLINRFNSIPISERLNLRKQCFDVWKETFNAETNSSRIFDYIQNDVIRSN